MPDNADVLYNEKGTAPGLLFQQAGKKLFALPGIPLEMEYLFDKYIEPLLVSEKTVHTGHRVLLTTGITEGDLWTRVEALDLLQQIVTVASLPSHLGVKIRLSAHGKSPEEVETRLQEAEQRIRAKIEGYIFGTDGDTLEGTIGRMLVDRKRTLAVAESCTGGLIGHRLTQISGSSSYFMEGAVTYSNEAKIRNQGAVSRPVALAMAEGIRQTAGTDLGLSVTGIAGPQGGTPQKPVGLTFIAVADAAESRCERFVFQQDRIRNQERAAQAALNLLRLWLLQS